MALVISILCLVPVFLYTRVRIAEMLRRHREPEVEAEVKRRLAANYAPIARPATPDVRMPNLHEWLTADPETYPINSFRPALAMYTGPIAVCIICGMYTDQNVFYTVVFILIPIAVGLPIYIMVHKPSLVWRVRREVRISTIARKHGAEYVAEDFPGQGLDLTDLRNRVDQVSRIWNLEGYLLDVHPRDEDNVSSGIKTKVVLSLLDVKPGEVIRCESHPYFEYGMEKLKTNVFRFYVLMETMPMPYIAVIREKDLRGRQQKKAMANLSVDQLYSEAPGCEGVFSSLSHRTRELMVGVHVDKMVADRGWAVFWWDSEEDATLTFGGQNWKGRMDMASEKTWDGVKKVQSLLTSLENDISIRGFR